MILYLAIAPLALFTLVRLYHLLNNYLAARRLDLPIILLPVSFEDAWWIPLRPLFSWVERLPFGLGSWYLYTEMGWPHVDGNRTGQRLGTENFVLCSPTNNVIATCYSPGVDRAFKDVKNWSLPEAQSQLFAFYGQNVSSTNGAEWQRHRKITSSAFNESTMKGVWSETVERAKAIDFDIENERSLGRIRSTFDVLAMHVLAAAGFGQDIELTTIPPGHRESLMGSLGFMLQHIVLTLLFSSLKAPDFVLPSTLKRLKVSVSEFKLYMEESVLRHMQSAATKRDLARPPSLLEAMVRANEAEKQLLPKRAGKPSYLTDSELYGNLFVFNLAGYETTAGTMTFALPYLAACPEAQDWLIEEVDRVYKNTNHEDYTATYPKLVRCLAVMYETLRLATPVPLMTRTPTSPQDFPIITSQGPRSVTLTPGTLIGANFYGAHLSPRWGKDVNEFRPQRFISKSPTGEEVLAVPDGPSYMPWVFGPRVCPGKKFSQVEFVAVVAQILSEYRIEILNHAHESREEAKRRLVGVLDEKYFNISAHLRRPEDAGIRFVRRNL